MSTEDIKIPKLESLSTSNFPIGFRNEVQVDLLKPRPFHIINKEYFDSTGAKGFLISKFSLKDIITNLKRYSRYRVTPQDIPFGSRSYISFQTLTLKKRTSLTRVKILDIRVWSQLADHDVIDTSRKDFLIDFDNVDFDPKLWSKMSKNLVPTRIFFRVNIDRIEMTIYSLKRSLHWYNRNIHFVREHISLAKSVIHLIIERNEARTWTFKIGEDSLMMKFIENIDDDLFLMTLNEVKTIAIAIDPISILCHIRVIKQVR